MFNTVNIGFNSIFLYSKNSECDTVDIKAQLIFTVMIYDRKSSLLFDRLAELTRFFWWTYMWSCVEKSRIFFLEKIKDNLYIYYDYQVILLTF